MIDFEPVIISYLFIPSTVLGAIYIIALFIEYFNGMKNKPIALTEGPFHKGGINPPNDSLERPPQPSGSNGPDRNADISTEAERINNAISEIRRKADQHIDNLKKKLKHLQQSCSHSKSSLQVDENGTDSYLKCEICGMQVKR